MRDVQATSYGSRFTVTEKGSLDLRTVETCSCSIKLFGLLFECEVCGTVYGHYKDLESGHPRPLGKRD